jgi:hypothetical protein
VSAIGKFIPKSGAECRVNADIGEHHPWCVAGNNREVGVGNGVFIQKRQKE